MMRKRIYKMHLFIYKCMLSFQIVLHFFVIFKNKFLDFFRPPLPPLPPLRPFRRDLIPFFLFSPPPVFLFSCSVYTISLLNLFSCIQPSLCCHLFPFLLLLSPLIFAISLFLFSSQIIFYYNSSFQFFPFVHYQPFCFLSPLLPYFYFRLTLFYLLSTLISIFILYNISSHFMYSLTSCSQMHTAILV